MGGGKRIIVLGGGLSGLSFLHYLRNFTVAFNRHHLISKVTLLEANDYMGGSVKTNTLEDGIIHELGPKSIRLGGFKSHNTVALLEQLGLSEKVVKSQEKQGRYIYHNGKVCSVPSSIGQLFFKIPFTKTTLFGAIWRDLMVADRMNLDPYPYKDPPIHDFVSHRFGADVADVVIDPLLRGITSGDCRQLSSKALIAKFLESDQEYGSVLKGAFKPSLTATAHDELFPNDIEQSKLLDKLIKEKAKSFNLTSGLQTIPEHLSNSLLNTNDDGVISIYNQTKVLSMEFRNKFLEDEPCSVDVGTVDGDRLRLKADHIVSTIPASQLTKILPDSTPSEQLQALDYLTKIPHSPVGCVVVEYRNLKKMPKIIDSFGLLTNSKSGSRVLGISFDSSVFPSQADKELGAVRMTCMMGGSWYKEIFGTDNMDQVTNAQLEQIALEEIRKILEIEDEPYRMSVHLWKTGIAQYLPGHNDRLAETRASIRKLDLPLTVLGQSCDGVAVNDVLFASRMAAYELVKSL